MKEVKLMAHVERSNTLAAKVRNALRTLLLRRDPNYRGNRPISPKVEAQLLNQVAKSARLEISKR
jgi:hypothetical protein